MKSLLRSPTIYQLSQVAGGFFSARVSAISQYLAVQAGQRVIDIGCGPGHIVFALPEGVIYHGFDVDQKYVDFANRHFGRRGSFHCRLLDEAAAEEFGPVDIVMMNGVLHHIDDDAARMTAFTAAKALKPGGIFFALDGVYTPDQDALAKWFLNNDRGKFVRTEDGYKALLTHNFAACEFHIHHDLTRIPYSLIISKCTKSP